jgi:Ribbon-helix-helix domain
MARMVGKRIISSVYLDPAVNTALKGLSDKTRISIAVYLREAVDDLLAKYKIKVRAEPGKSAVKRK